jgi:hypothetical protein
MDDILNSTVVETFQICFRLVKIIQLSFVRQHYFGRTIRVKRYPFARDS